MASVLSEFVSFSSRTRFSRFPFRGRLQKAFSVPWTIFGRFGRFNRFKVVFFWHFFGGVFFTIKNKLFLGVIFFCCPFCGQEQTRFAVPFSWGQNGYGS